MGEKRTPLQNADFFIWVGIEALYIWDRRRGEERTISLLPDGEQAIPYVPCFHMLWEKPDYFETELRKVLGRRRCRILMAVPEDITFIEDTALKDFIYAALGRRLKRRNGLITCGQSTALGRPQDQYIALTRTCRCYCVTLVKNGEAADSQLLDVYRCERSALEWEIRDFRAASPERSLKIYYPETEEDWALMRLGRNVAFSNIATMDKAPQKQEDEKIQRLP